MRSSLIELSEFDILSVHGPDSKKFLQGQLSCNTEDLHSGQSLIGAICNIKGRVIADFRLIEFEQCCYLLLSPGMASIVKLILDKYIVFSKAKTEIVTDCFHHFGLIGSNASKLLNDAFGNCPANVDEVTILDNCLVIRIPGLIPRYEILLKQTASDTDSAIESGKAKDGAIDRIIEQTEKTDRQKWELEDIRVGIVHITERLSEQYLPETLNFDKSGVINFKKGCYTGQEIIARMFYRGVAKKRMFYGRCVIPNGAPETVEAGVAGDDIRGEILTHVQTDNNNFHMLLVLPATAISEGMEFYLNGSPELGLELIAIPYLKI